MISKYINVINRLFFKLATEELALKLSKLNFGSTECRRALYKLLVVYDGYVYCFEISKNYGLYSAAENHDEVLVTSYKIDYLGLVSSVDFIISAPDWNLSKAYSPTALGNHKVSVPITINPNYETKDKTTVITFQLSTSDIQLEFTVKLDKDLILYYHYEVPAITLKYDTIINAKATVKSAPEVSYILDYVIHYASGRTISTATLIDSLVGNIELAPLSGIINKTDNILTSNYYITNIKGLSLNDFKFSINRQLGSETTGTVTGASMEDNWYKDALDICQVTITCSCNGVEGTATSIVKQAKNVVETINIKEYGIHYDTVIPAKGGTSDYIFDNLSVYATFSSNVVREVSLSDKLNDIYGQGTFVHQWHFEKNDNCEEFSVNGNGTVSAISLLNIISEGKTCTIKYWTAVNWVPNEGWGVLSDFTTVKKSTPVYLASNHIEDILLNILYVNYPTSILAKGSTSYPSCVIDPLIYVFSSETNSTEYTKDDSIIELPALTYNIKYYFYNESGNTDLTTDPNNNFTINANTGVVTGYNRGIVIGNEVTSTNIVLSVYLNVDGFSKTFTYTSLGVKQNANLVTDIIATLNSFEYPGPVSAGEVNVDVINEINTYEYYYSSGEHSSQAIDSKYGSISTSISYSLDYTSNEFSLVSSDTGRLKTTSRGTLIGNARTSGNVTKSLQYTWTHSAEYGGSVVISREFTTTATCTQEGNYVTAIYTDTSLSYRKSTYIASYVLPTLSSATTFDFTSGVSKSTACPTEEFGTLTYDYTFNMSATDRFTSIEEKTGKVTINTLNPTTISEEVTSNTITCATLATWTPNDAYLGTTVTSTDSDTATCSQESNKISSVEVSNVSLSYNGITAKASKTETPTINYQVLVTFTSKNAYGRLHTLLGNTTSSTDPITNLNGYGTIEISYSTTSTDSNKVNGFGSINSSTGVINATNRLTDEGAARSSATVTGTVSFASPTNLTSTGSQISHSSSNTATCTQAGNKIESIDKINIVPGNANYTSSTVPLNGGYGTLDALVTYTSEATALTSLGLFNYTFAISANSDGSNATNLVISNGGSIILSNRTVTFPDRLTNEGGPWAIYPQVTISSTYTSLKSYNSTSYARLLENKKEDIVDLSIAIANFEIAAETGSTATKEFTYSYKYLYSSQSKGETLTTDGVITYGSVTKSDIFPFSESYDRGTNKVTITATSNTLGSTVDNEATITFNNVTLTRGSLSATLSSVSTRITLKSDVFVSYGIKYKTQPAWDNIPATGESTGIKTNPVVQITKIYLSGYEAVYIDDITYNNTTYGSWSFGKKNASNGLSIDSTGHLTCSSKETNISNSGSIGKAYCKYTASNSYGGVSLESDYIDIQQSGNYVTSIEAVPSSGTTHFYYDTIASASTSGDPTLTGAIKLNFSSGKSTTISNSYEGLTNISYSRDYTKVSGDSAMSVNSSTGKITTSANDSGLDRSCTIESTLTVSVTHTSTYSNGGTKTATLTNRATCTLKSVVYGLVIEASSTSVGAGKSTITLAAYYKGFNASNNVVSSLNVTSSVTFYSSNESVGTIKNTTLTISSRGTSYSTTTRSTNITCSTYDGLTAETLTITLAANTRETKDGSSNYYTSITKNSDTSTAGGGSITFTVNAYHYLTLYYLYASGENSSNWEVGNPVYDNFTISLSNTTRYSSDLSSGTGKSDGVSGTVTHSSMQNYETSDSTIISVTNSGDSTVKLITSKTVTNAAAYKSATVHKASVSWGDGLISAGGGSRNYNVDAWSEKKEWYEYTSTYSTESSASYTRSGNDSYTVTCNTGSSTASGASGRFSINVTNGSSATSGTCSHTSMNANTGKDIVSITVTNSADNTTATTENDTTTNSESSASSYTYYAVADPSYTGVSASGGKLQFTANAYHNVRNYKTYTSGYNTLNSASEVFSGYDLFTISKSVTGPSGASDRFTLQTTSGTGKDGGVGCLVDHSSMGTNTGKDVVTVTVTNKSNTAVTKSCSDYGTNNYNGPVYYCATDPVWPSLGYSSGSTASKSTTPVFKQYYYYDSYGSGTKYGESTLSGTITYSISSSYASINSSNGTITTSSANGSTSSRNIGTAKATMSNYGVSSKDVTIYQNGKPATVTKYKVVSTTSASWNDFGANGSNATINTKPVLKIVEYLELDGNKIAGSEKDVKTNIVIGDNTYGTWSYHASNNYSINSDYSVSGASNLDTVNISRNVLTTVVIGFTASSTYQNCIYGDSIPIYQEANTKTFESHLYNGTTTILPKSGATNETILVPAGYLTLKYKSGATAHNAVTIANLSNYDYNVYKSITPGTDATISYGKSGNQPIVYCTVGYNYGAKRSLGTVTLEISDITFSGHIWYGKAAIVRTIEQA